MRRTAGSAAWLLVLAALLSAPPASAQFARYPIAGDVRFQIGNGLPFPLISPGAANVAPGAAVRNTIASPDPRPLALDPGVITHPGTPMTVGVFIGNPVLFQARTAITVQFPAYPVTLEAGGRTGAATVNWCPGITITASGTGGCLTPAAGPGINGRVTYTATSAQFGGAAAAALGGGGDIALRAGASAPCDYNFTPTCLVAFALATPPAYAPQGAAFNLTTSFAAPVPTPGLYMAVVTGLGQVAALTPFGLGPGIPNSLTSYGAPWTTGMVSLLNTAALGTPQNFVLSGSDNRVNGVGTISLVSGGMGVRNLSGASANRGWLSLTVGAGTPSLGGWGAAALAVVLAGTALSRLRRPTP